MKLITDEMKGFLANSSMIRKMFEAIGKNVAFLKRTKIGELTLRGMDRGQVRKLTPEEVGYLAQL